MKNLEVQKGEGTLARHLALPFGEFNRMTSLALTSFHCAALEDEN